MHGCPIDEPPLFRIRRNVAELPPEILAIANPMLMESHLPHFTTKLRPQFMGEPALDALGATLDGLVWSRSQQNM
jgi:hypothetical protein